MGHTWNLRKEMAPLNGSMFDSRMRYEHSKRGQGIQKKEKTPHDSVFDSRLPFHDSRTSITHRQLKESPVAIPPLIVGFTHQSSPMLAVFLTP
jgi:hypothetical protein